MSAAAREGWADRAEAGSVAALRAMASVDRLLGRRAARALLWPIALYFTLTQRRTRDASRAYLRALRRRADAREQLPREPSWRDVLRHVHAFAVNIYERAVAWGGGLDQIRFDHAGSEHLFRLAREGRGAILLGSHLGSFDMMRLLAGDHGLVVNVLMYTEHVERITSFFQRLDPDSRVRVMRLDPSSTRTAFDVRAALERGEFVGILGDRAFGAERTRAVEFLGRPAPFALQPFLLAMVLRAPLLFAVCIQRGPGHYEAAVELLHDGSPVPRAERDARAEAMLGAYVARLEAWCARAPLQWFNFYDFWTGSVGGRP